MINVGFIDDDEEWIDTFKDLYTAEFESNGLNLIIAPRGTLEDIKQWVVDNDILCLIIDYKITDSGAYQFNGNRLKNYLDDNLKGFSCLILTAAPEKSQEEDTVLPDFIVPRSKVMTPSEIEDFVVKIKHYCKVTEHNKEEYEQEYQELLDLKNNGNIKQGQDERLRDLYRVMLAYDMVDDIPSEMMKSEMSQKIEELLENLDILTKKMKEERERRLEEKLSNSHHHDHGRGR